MADGCFGAAVAAWAEGIGKVTGKAFALPRGGSTDLATLIDALLAHCPNIAEREAFARAKGEAFARAYRGKLNGLAFKDWLNSPDASPAPAAGNPEGPAVLAARQRRDTEFANAEANAVPPPPEVREKLAALGLRIGRGAG
jgi:hypothetical protein